MYWCRKLYETFFFSFIFRKTSENPDDGLTVDELIEFFNSKQRDPRLNEILYPFYNVDRVKQIIRTYELDEKLKEKSKCVVLCNLRQISLSFYRNEDRSLIRFVFVGHEYACKLVQMPVEILSTFEYTYW